MKKFFALLTAMLVSLSFAQAEDVETTTVQDDGISKKWEFRIGLGGQIGIKEPSGSDAGYTRRGESVQLDLGGGYNFNRHLYLGIASGYYLKYGHTENQNKNNIIVPVLGDITYRWNPWEKWSIFAEARAGYLFNFKKNESIGNQDYDPVGYSAIEITPGVYYRVRPNIDLYCALGYAYGATAEDSKVNLTKDEKCFIAKIGMNFRKAPKIDYRTTPIEEPLIIGTDTVVVHDTIYVPQPVKIVETTTEEQKSLGEREVVIFYTIRKHNILPEKDALLMEMALFTKTHKTSKIVLKSYADKGTGNYKLNQMYSKNRMEEVKKHLIEKYGINPEQIEASYYGDTVQPFEENDLNRCSIITVKEVE